MKKCVFGFRKRLHLVLAVISMFALQSGLTWADPFEDNMERVGLAGLFGEEGAEAFADIAKNNMAEDLATFSLSSADEVKQFTAKYCKGGIVFWEMKDWRMDNPKTMDLMGRIAGPPGNHNDDDGSHCFKFKGKVLQVLGDNEALYSGNDRSGHLHTFYISFGKGGRAISEITAIATVKGGYKYQSLAGIKIAPQLTVIKMAGK